MGDRLPAMDQSPAAFNSNLFGEALSAYLKPLNMFHAPFQVGWYNSMRHATAGGTQLIEAPDNAWAYIIASKTGYFNNVVQHFNKSPSANGDFVDDTTEAIMRDIVQTQCSPSLGAVAYNADKPPYLHVQTIGHVAGMVQHVDVQEASVLTEQELIELKDELRENRDVKMWGEDGIETVFGLSLHPVYGGWFVFRIVLVLKDVFVDVEKPLLLNFLENDDKKKALKDYNLSGDLGRWRDVPDSAKEHRYTALEYIYFTPAVNQEKRRRILELSQ